MKFKTHNDVDIDVIGTSLCGGLHGVSYNRLVELFGEPMEGDGDKVDAEWHLEFVDEDGNTVVATIYNWKSGRAYLGENGLEIYEITDWNIGGFGLDSAVFVCEVVGA